MEFIIGLAAGIAVGLIAQIPTTHRTTKNSADRHVQTLSSKAQKALTDLKQTRQQIVSVSQKADAANRTLTQQISELSA